MKHIIKFLCLTLFITVCCKKVNSLKYRSDNLNKIYKGTCENEDCAEVTIDYVKIIGEEMVSERINLKIKDFIISSLNFNVEDSTQYNNISEAANNFLDSYAADKSEFPDIGTYFAEIVVSESYISRQLLCYEMSQYMYTGGAHGYGSTWYLNIDPLTGDDVPSEELFKNEVEFTAFAESKFIKEMEIPEGESINSTGFWFENDIFYLPETIGFTKDQLIILYNQYEIASYAQGPIDLVIPLEEARPFLNFE